MITRQWTIDEMQISKFLHLYQDSQARAQPDRPKRSFFAQTDWGNDNLSLKQLNTLSILFLMLILNIIFPKYGQYEGSVSLTFRS